MIGRSTKSANSLPTSWADVLLAVYPIWVFCFWVAAFTLSINTRGADWWGSVLSTGLVMSYMGINAAHELIHRRKRAARRAGELLLMLVNFPHWGIEHMNGHHTHVGTDRDPASARRGEWLYPYLLRSYLGGIRSAFRRKPLRVLILFNLQVLLNGVVFVAFGVPALLFVLAQSAVAIVLLETVDYIQHYGLRRQLQKDGRPEPFGPQHAWDCVHLVTNGTLLNLGYHSHHHQRAAVPYQELPNLQGPLMPMGYSAMILLALVPPLFFAVMNPRLKNNSADGRGRPT